MFCSKCGSQIPQDGRFCSSCGQTVSSEVAASPVAVPAMNQGAPAPDAGLPWWKGNFSLWAGLGFLIPIVGLIIGLVFINQPLAARRRDGAQTLAAAGLGFLLVIVFLSVLASTGDLPAFLRSHR